MADIELVIKIPENTYRRIQALARDDYFEHDICGNSMKRIANGIPLKRGHGDLIDRDNLLVDSYYTCDLSGDEINIVDVMTVKMADAIIEADKEQSDE